MERGERANAVRAELFVLVYVNFAETRNRLVINLLREPVKCNAQVSRCVGGLGSSRYVDVVTRGVSKGAREGVQGS